MTCRVYFDSRTTPSCVGGRALVSSPACEHCDGERSLDVRNDRLRGYVCPPCDSSLDEMFEERELTEAQGALLVRVLDSGSCFVHGADVRVARALAQRGLITLEDNGSMLNTRRRSDGERWWAKIVVDQ